MRISLRTATAIVLGGVMATAATLPAQAGEPVRLADDHLDQITAGSALVGVVLGGGGQANGALASFSHLIGEVNGGGDQLFLLASGYVVSVNFALGKGATTSSTTGGSGSGDIDYTVTTPVSGGNNWFRFSASATGSAAASVR